MRHLWFVPAPRHCTVGAVKIGAQIIGAPGPLRWLGYAFGCSLPPRYKEWVLRDLTARGWQLRQLVRSVVQVVPFAAVVVALVPGELWVRLLAVLGGTIVGMIYAAAYVYESTEHRALKAGYRRGTLQQVRDEADAGKRAAADERYALRYRQE